MPATPTSYRRAPAPPPARSGGDELLHAGAGSGMFLIQPCVALPGLLPTIRLLGLVTAIAVLPIAITACAAALVLAPVFGLHRLATRGRRGERGAPAPRQAPRIQSSTN